MNIRSLPFGPFPNLKDQYYDKHWYIIALTSMQDLEVSGFGRYKMVQGYEYHEIPWVIVLLHPALVVLVYNWSRDVGMRRHPSGSGELRRRWNSTIRTVVLAPMDQWSSCCHNLLSSSLIISDLHWSTSLYISLFRWSGWSEFHYDASYSSQQNDRVEIALLPRLREWKMTDWCLRWCHACLRDTHWSKPYETPIQSTWGPLSLEMYSVSWIINDQWSWYSSCISPARSSNNRNHRHQYIRLYKNIIVY